MRKICTSCIFLILLSSAVWAADKPVDQETILLNFVVPGLSQIKQGKDEGWWYTPGTAMMIGGALLQGKNYMPIGENYRWYNATGTIIAEAGEMLWAYSQYAYLNDIGIIWPTYQRQSLPELMAAPWVPTNFTSVDVFPIVGLGILTSVPFLFDSQRPEHIGEYFGAETVRFWGFDMNPWAAYGCYFSWSLIMSNLTAVTEECLFRGMVSGTLPSLSSSALFGGMHAANLLVQEATPKTIRDTALQVASSFCMGLYLDNLVRENNGDLQKAISVHQWWNVAAFSFAFFSAISDPDYVKAHTPTPDGKELTLSSYMDIDCHPGILLKYNY